ncbi:MAG: PIN domain-containing protein [Clostridia bacterium]|nr:PIN domain-containing protein [Clostridia bacterium]
MKLYLETTMFNYYFDAERDGHEDTVRLFKAIRAGKYDAYTSEYVEIELRKASEPKRSAMLALINEYGIKVFPIDGESRRLARLYVARKAIPERFRFDSAHIAVASVHGLDYVLSYNFRHINRAKTKLLTGRVNSEEGFETVVICTAKEVLDDEQSDDE